MNAFAMAADHFLLSGRYADVDADLVDDLRSASVHALWAPYSLPSQDDTVAYVEGVVSLLRAARERIASVAPGDGAGSARSGSGELDFRLLTMRPVHLGRGPWSDAAVARMERWLSVQRPDLESALLRELCLAAYLRHRREGLTPTQASVLAWLGHAAPRATGRVRRPRRADADTRRVGRPQGSGRVIRSPEVFRAAYDKVGAGRAGQPTQQAVADELGVSVRTLQNRLRNWQIRWADLP